MSSLSSLRASTRPERRRRVCGQFALAVDQVVGAMDRRSMFPIDADLHDPFEEDVLPPRPLATTRTALVDPRRRRRGDLEMKQRACLFCFGVTAFAPGRPLIPPSSISMDGTALVAQECPNLQVLYILDHLKHSCLASRRVANVSLRDPSGTQRSAPMEAPEGNGSVAGSVR
ncbi:hypothetical protein EXIGLDRAFT_36707 [Exidia glandulosa HHB12029]|uniref:Uncharacterized protein n=1 Tax=Exidia glandulosa HHB12029 TaxID=1314781 RepID=A0A165IPG5_EXIGL|nr:hypothetical protein EXIGLDRAFT_36707 [Exidia glandulosa HHB12029]